MRIFTNSLDKQSFFSHVKSAHPLTRCGIYAALGLKYVFGEKLSRVPLLGIVNGSISALIKMHQGTTVETRGPLEPKCIFNHNHNNFDLIVIGSGPGASIVAQKNQIAGRSVLVLEKGTELDDSVPHHSPEQMKYFFESGGQEIIYSIPPIPFAQGSVLGGGSEINSGLYHRLPKEILPAWLEATGLSSESWTNAEVRIEHELRIAPQPLESLGIYSDSPIRQMQKELNWAGGLIPRWRTYNKNNFIHHGMSSTYLKSASSNGAEILAGHEVKLLRMNKGEPEVLVTCSTGTHVFKSKKLCLAAGTTGTPTLLWRSNLARWRDFKFSFHAMVREIAKFPQDVSDLSDIDPFQMWTPSKELKIGAAVSTPRLLAATLASKEIPVPISSDFAKLGVYYISLKSQGNNGLVPAGKRLVPYFWPGKAMRESLLVAQETLRDAIQRVGGNPLGKSAPSVSTVHVFGSLPLGDTRVLDKQGFVVGTNKKIFVRDGSLLPTHPTVNPQGPLMHLIDALEEERLRG